MPYKTPGTYRPHALIFTFPNLLTFCDETAGNIELTFYSLRVQLTSWMNHRQDGSREVMYASLDPQSSRVHDFSKAPEASR